MKCQSCEGKGFVESHFGAGASFTPSIQMCGLCRDITAYSEEVQKRLNGKAPTPRPVLRQVNPEPSAKILSLTCIETTHVFIGRRFVCQCGAKRQ